MTFYGSDLLFSDQVMHTREDHVITVHHPDGIVVVQHCDGTRITSQHHMVPVEGDCCDPKTGAFVFNDYLCGIEAGYRVITGDEHI